MVIIMDLFAYKVKIFDEVDNKIEYAEGFVNAETYAEATKKIIDVYGEKELFSLMIEWCEESIGIVETKGFLASCRKMEEINKWNTSQI